MSKIKKIVLIIIDVCKGLAITEREEIKKEKKKELLFSLNKCNNIGTAAPFNRPFDGDD